MILVKENNKENWNRIVSKSKQFNLLSSKDFFQGLTCPYDLYYVKEFEKVLMASIVFKKIKNKEKFYLQDFNYNQGIFFFENNVNLISTKKRNELINFFLKEITKKYNNLRFSLNYEIKDIRAFQWFEYPKNYFKINTVYSSIIDLNEINNFENYLSILRYSRRREYKLFQKTGYKIVSSKNIKDFLYLYKNYENDVGTLAFKTHIKLIKNSIKNNFSRINLLTKENKIIASTIFYFDNFTGYYAFSSQNKNIKLKFSKTTPLIIEQINFAFKNRISKIDMLGVNSPARADFKESFGGKLKSFYEIIYNKKK